MRSWFFYWKDGAGEHINLLRPKSVVPGESHRERESNLSENIGREKPNKFPNLRFNQNTERSNLAQESSWWLSREGVGEGRRGTSLAGKRECATQIWYEHTNTQIRLVCGTQIWYTPRCCKVNCLYIQLLVIIIIRHIKTSYLGVKRPDLSPLLRPWHVWAAYHPPF